MIDLLSAMITYSEAVALMNDCFWPKADAPQPNRYLHYSSVFKNREIAQKHPVKSQSL